MLEHAYSVARDAFKVRKDGTLEGDEAAFNVMDIFPPYQPLAKMTLPLKFGVQRLDRLIVGCLMELIATQPDPGQCCKSISSFAKTLIRVAMYFAKLIASIIPRPWLDKLLSPSRPWLFHCTFFKGSVHFSVMHLDFSGTLVTVSYTRLSCHPYHNPSSTDALVHEFGLPACSHSSLFTGSFLFTSLIVLDLLLSGYLFNGPLYIPVVSLALLTKERTAWDLPKQRRAKKKPAVLYHPCMMLTDDDTESLSTSQFGVKPVYEELLRSVKIQSISSCGIQETNFQSC